MVAQRRDVKNCVKKKHEAKIPVQNPTSASSGNSPKLSTMNSRNEADTLADKNSPSIAMERTIIDKTGKGVA